MSKGAREDSGGGRPAAMAVGPPTGDAGGGRDGAIGAESERIVQGLLGGRTDAAETVRRWADGVARHRAWGFETPEDIVQEVFLALLRNLREGRFTAGDLCAYVRRLTKNICISRYRKARVRGVQVTLSTELPAADQDSSPEALESAAAAGRILARLDPRCREIVVLAYFDGLSRGEIARRLGVSETAAKVRLFRCMERARAMRSVRDAGGDR